MKNSCKKNQIYILSKILSNLTVDRHGLLSHALRGQDGEQEKKAHGTK